MDQIPTFNTPFNFSDKFIQEIPISKITFHNNVYYWCDNCMKLYHEDNFNPEYVDRDYNIAFCKKCTTPKAR